MRWFIDFLGRLWGKAFLALSVLLVAFGIAAGQPPQDRWERLARVAAAHARHGEALMEVPDVVGVGIGMDAKGNPVLKVFAKHHKPAGVPPKLDGADVEIVPTGEFYALAPPSSAAAKSAAKPSIDRPPTVKFVSPQYGETLVGNVILRVNATDDKGVTKVEFYYQQYGAYYNDNASPLLLGTDFSGSDGWSYTWSTNSVGDDRYILWAVAYDTKGQTGSHNVTIFVDNTSGEPPAYSPDRPDDKPVSPIGVSVGNQYEASAGTIGCRVKDSTGRLFILSNNHVLALENTAPLNSWILQPGLYDTGSDILYAWQVVGTLTTYVPITFSRRANNKVDAAIAQIKLWGLDPAIPLVATSTPSDGYGTPSTDYLTNDELAAWFATSQIPVQKYGRTTKWTTGTITSINTTVVVSYSRGQARFVNQIVVQSPGAFILPGDSGSLLVTQGSPRPVGLLFAGNSSGTYAVANRIQDVLDALSSTLGSELTIDDGGQGTE